MTGSRRGLTLVEVLVVAAVLAMAAGTLSVALRGSAEGAEWHRAIGEVRHLDWMTRIRARVDGPSLIVLTDGGLASSVQSSEAPIAAVSAPAGVAIAIRGVRGEGTAGGQSRSCVVVDGAGRSESVSYVLRGARRAVSIPVSGHTGQHGETVEESP